MKRASITEELVYGSALERLTGAGKPAAELPQKKPVTDSGGTMIKLSVFLNRDADAYLENLASTAKFTGGRKLSKTKLVAAMVRAFSATGLDVRGVNSDDELLKRITAQLRK